MTCCSNFCCSYCTKAQQVLQTEDCVGILQWTLIPIHLLISAPRLEKENKKKNRKNAKFPPAQRVWCKHWNFNLYFYNTVYANLYFTKNSGAKIMSLSSSLLVWPNLNLTPPPQPIKKKNLSYRPPLPIPCLSPGWTQVFRLELGPKFGSGVKSALDGAQQLSWKLNCSFKYWCSTQFLSWRFKKKKELNDKTGRRNILTLKSKLWRVGHGFLKTKKVELFIVPKRSQGKFLAGVFVTKPVVLCKTFQTAFLRSLNLNLLTWITFSRLCLNILLPFCCRGKIDFWLGEKKEKCKICFDSSVE